MLSDRVAGWFKAGLSVLSRLIPSRLCSGSLKGSPCKKKRKRRKKEEGKATMPLNLIIDLCRVGARVPLKDLNGDPRNVRTPHIVKVLLSELCIQDEMERKIMHFVFVNNISLKS